MPTYEYKCTNCDFHFERFQQMSAEPLQNCPLCDAPVTRLIGSGAGFIMNKGHRSSQGGRGRANSCDRQSPCCGRETRCDTPPCK